MAAVCFAGTKMERRPAPGPTWQPLGALGQPHGARGDPQAQTTMEALHKATSVGNAHRHVPCRGDNGAVLGPRRAAAWGLGADARSPGGAASADNDGGTPRKMAPGQRPQGCQRLDGDNAQATLAMAPAQQPQGRQRHDGNIGNSASAKTAITPASRW